MGGLDTSDALRSRREHAEFRARRSQAGIGAAVVFSGFEAGEHVWDRIITDRREWHYIRVLGPELGPYVARGHRARDRALRGRPTCAATNPLPDECEPAAPRSRWQCA